MPESDLLAFMRIFGNAGIPATHDPHQYRINSPAGSSTLVLRQIPSRLNDHTLYVLFEFNPDGALVSFQVSE